MLWIFKIIKNRILLETNFEKSIIHKPSPGSPRFRKKCGPDQFSRFDVNWIKTDKQTDK